MNEIGDFFAGAFGPVAFFWLVLGHFQQSLALKQNSDSLKMQADELKNSVKALNLQADELKSSVIQQREMVNITKDHFEFDRQQIINSIQERRAEMSPDFSYRTLNTHYNSNGTRAYTIKFLNIGKKANLVSIDIVNEHGERPVKLTPAGPIRTITHNESNTWSFDYPTKPETQELTITIKSEDIISVFHEQKYCLRRNGDTFREVQVKP